MPRLQLYIFSAFQALAAAILLWKVLTLGTPWTAQRIVGTILAGVGLCLVGLARFQLGESFAVRARAHKLVTHGLYSKIRNPVYVFGVVTFAGVIVIFQMPPLWLLLVALIIFQTIRARRESAVLEAAFGDEYREYRSRTWF
jgi:protein-S-isoprenylcysteine O-methyltransferase Ste14